jgi:hypothetical protein
MILILFIFSFLNSQDVIKYPEKLPINNQEVIEHLKQKEKPQLLGDEYWDDDRILFSTYFGGSGYDCINDGAFDSKGNFIQVGYTGSPDLPIVGDAFQKEKNLNHDMFIVKWNPDGDVIWSTFLGGSGSDVLYSVAIDKNDDIIVAGRTESTDIIVSDNAPQLKNNGGSDFYIAKFTNDGDYVWSTYWGGDKEEMQCRMVIDEVGNIYLGGNTTSETMTTREDAYQRSMDKEYVLNNEWQTKSGVYLAKFTNEGKYNWGTYFATGTYRRPDPLEAKMSLSLTEILTGIDVYKDEIAFSWDLEQYFVRGDDTLPLPEFLIVTDDAEQKEGVKNTGWQTQVFKMDTAGTTLKYGTFYSGDDCISRNIKYDKDGNLILHVATLRDIPKKDSVFKSTGHLVFVKYNKKNELEWDFGFGCLDRGLETYDFDIDENNVLWTAGVTSCNDLEQSINAFPSKWGPDGGSGFIFVLDLVNYRHWSSYIDLGLNNSFSIEVFKEQLLVSGCNRLQRIKNAFQSDTKDRNIESGFAIILDMKNVFNYEDTSGIDTTKVIYDYFYYLENDKLIINSKDSINNIKIVDLNGRQLFQDKYYSNTIEIDKTKYSKGVYFVIINEKKILKCLIY